MAIGRALLLLFFAMVESRDLKIRSTVTLVVIALLQLMKMVARLTGYWPDLTPLMDTSLDAALVLCTAVALFVAGGSIRRAENKWAGEVAVHRQGVFADFNNPEHEWNRED